jgi:hypothetical protein
MMLAAAGAACTLVSVPPPPPPSISNDRAYISRAAIAADIDSTFATIERVHPNPYTVVSRDSVQRARDAIVAALPDSATPMAAWSSYARLVALIGDGHTSVHAPGQYINRFIGRGGQIFPTRTTTTAGGALAVTAYRFGDTLLRRGDELLSVNDRPVDSLLRAFASEIGGETERWREAVAAQQFETLLLLNDVRPPFTAEVRSSGDASPRRLSVRAIGRDSLLAANRRASVAPAPRMSSSNFTYRLLPGGVAYMNLLSLEGDLGPFRDDLVSMFRRMQSDSARTLIIDLRSNGGGDSRLGDELLSHVTTQAYRMSSAKLWKMSDEFRAYMKSWVRAPINHLPIEKTFPTGRRLFSGPAGTIVRLDERPEAHARSEPYFDGPVCVLIGAGTFSSAVDLSDAIKTYRLATLIGEETGGRANAFGEIYYFRTSATDYLVTVSSAEFVRASGDTTDHRGVMPDIEVLQSAEDLRAGRDPVIERARECPSRAR